MREVKEVVVSGSPFERGLIHGRALRREIAALRDDLRARIGLAPAPPESQAENLRTVDGYARAIERDLPVIADELRGLAAGARIRYSDAVMLQARRELIGVVEHAAQGDCTLVAYRRRSGDAVIAQTVDVNSNLADYLVLLRVLPDGRGEPETLLVTFAGLLGYLGVNSHGLGVGINLVISPVWGAGVPPYLLVRHLLQQDTVGRCVSEIGRIRRGSSRSLTIADRRNVVTLEMTKEEQRVSVSDFLCHTNHYLHPELLAADRMNVLSRNNSRRRLAKIHGALAGRCDGVGIEELVDVFVDHSMHPFGICAHADGNPNRGETVCTVVMEPGKGRLHVRPGLPCVRERVQTFSLRQSPAPEEASVEGAIAEHRQAQNELQPPTGDNHAIR
jgi:isopenicillin-N N-acyltransferase-like protein